MKNLILLTVILAGFSTFAENSKPSGLYRAVSELCSDGSVYMHDELVMTSSTTDGFELTMDFLSDSRVKVSMLMEAGTPLNEDGTTITGSYTVEYSLNNNKLIYGKITDWNYPANGMLMNREQSQSYLESGPVTQLSVNPSQLILSYPGFDGNGRCKAPAYIVNIYEKVN